MIKAIVFDFGNVICYFYNSLFLKNISVYTNKTVAELDDLIYRRSNLPIQYETGLITSDQFFEKITTLCNLSINKVDFRKAFTTIYTPIPSTFKLIKKLKMRYKLGLLSNVSEWQFDYGIKRISIFKLFDAVSTSFQVGAMKPNRKIFYDILDKLKLTPEKCVYIDDTEEFVKVAQQIGFHVIKYQSHELLLKSLIDEDLDVKN